MYDVLSLPQIDFPPGFLWGSATAAYQIEGGNDNTDHAAREGPATGLEVCGKACNSYELFKEDIALLKQLGHQAYRFSIEWARVEPVPGTFSAEAVEHYVEQCRCLAEAGIQPWVTLHHISNPLWLEKMGGWLQPESIDLFLRYVDHIVPRIAQYVKGWTPMNEYNLIGGVPPQPARHVESARRKLHLLLADGMTYDRIKAHSQAPIGSSIAFLPIYPNREHDELDRTLAAYARWCSWGFYYHAMRTGEWMYPFMDAQHCPQLKGRADFWAVNIYTRRLIDSRKAGTKPPRYLHKHLPLLPIDFYGDEMAPDQLMFNLERLLDKPVYITENGLATHDDRFRIAYMALHYAAFRQAIDHGVDLRGLFHWSLMDNYEWGSWAPTFGLAACDRQTFKRTPRPSAAFYREIIQANGFSGQTVRKYLDRLPSRSDI